METIARKVPVTLSLLPLVLLAFVVLGGCATVPRHMGHVSPDASPGKGVSSGKLGKASPIIDKVLASAKSLLGQKPNARVTVRGRAFTLDCIGTVSAAYWGAGVDILRDFARYDGDGVNRLYESLRSKGALHWKKVPSPGDIVFWDHTWDTTGDPAFKNGHTHAGIVMSVDDDGTVHYLHESVTRGVVVAYLNLLEPRTGIGPDGKVYNSPMYLGSNFGKKDNPAHWLSGDLWSAFGDAEKTAVSYAGF